MKNLFFYLSLKQRNIFQKGKAAVLFKNFNVFYFFICALIFPLLGGAGVGLAQAPPQGINYQGVMRDTLGNPQATQTFSVQIEIHSGQGTTIYSEMHYPVQTNAFGLYSLVIGAGTVITSGQTVAFNKIPWGNGNMSVYVYVTLPCSSCSNIPFSHQLMSVPYALYAGSTGGVDSVFVTSPIKNTGTVIRPVIGIDTAAAIWNAKKLQSIPINTVTPVNGQILRYDSSGKWSPYTPLAANLVWLIGGNNISANDYLGTKNSRPMRIVTNSAERMHIDTNGNVGIGTTNPNALLDISNPVSTAIYPAVNISNSNASSALQVTTSGAGHSGIFSGGAGLSTDSITITKAAQKGYVLVSDTAGHAKWKPLPGLTNFGTSVSSTAQSFSVGTGTVTLAFPNYTNGGASFSGNEFVAPTAGIYHFDVQITVSNQTATSGGTISLALYDPILSSTYRQTQWSVPLGLAANTYIQPFIINADILLGAGQSVIITFSNNSTNTTYDINPNPKLSWFSGHKVN